MDYYKILNLKEDATIKEIEQAYLDLSSFYNPKNNVSKLAYKRYREINRAYNVLKENKSRELYNLSLKNKKEEIVVSEGNRVELKEFDSGVFQDKQNIEKFKDISVSEEFSDYSYVYVTLPYLYYLLNSEYEINYTKKIIVSSKGVCATCLGVGKVKHEEKVVYCKSCLATGQQIVSKDINAKQIVKVDDRIVDHDHKLIVDFEFTNKDEYEVNGNVINIKHVVSDEEFNHGFKMELKKDNEMLSIDERDFNEKKSYVFIDKIINVEYVLTSYKGKDKKGYLLTDKDVIYLNLKDYSYSFISDNKCNYKVEITDKVIVLNNLGDKGYNNENGDLILEVIKCKNDNELKIFFDRKIKKVSARLFKLNGEYNKHHFSNKKWFDYDSNYIYLPSLAYKLELKHFTLFKIIFSVLPLVISIIMFLIFGFSHVFFIVSFITLIATCIGVNFIMEVKI